eukprot:7614998-Pyramimonas_sp.AAC.1
MWSPISGMRTSRRADGTIIRKNAPARCTGRCKPRKRPPAGSSAIYRAKFNTYDVFNIWDC